MDDRQILNIGRKCMILQFIWFSLLTTIVMYVIVAWLVVKSDILTARAPVGIISSVLIILSAGLATAQLLLRTFLSDDKLFSRIIARMPDNLSDEMEADDCASHMFLANHMSLSIVIWVMGEAPAIFGLVLTFLSVNIRYVAGFALYSILNMFFFRPRRGDFENQLERLRRYLAVKG